LWGWSIFPDREGEGFAWLRSDPWALDRIEFLTDFAKDLTSFLVGQRRWLEVNAKTGELKHLAWLPGAQIHPLQRPKVGEDGEDTSRLFYLGTFGVIRRRSVSFNSHTYHPRLPTTLTGELPRVFVQDDVILTLLPRSYGYDLERIDAAKGENVWKAAPRLCPQAFGSDSLHFTRDAVYYVSGNRMYARALADGKLVWQKELPQSTTGWRLLGSQQALLVYPAGEPEPAWITGPLGKYWVSLPVRKVRANRAFALRVHAFQSGELLQELDFGVTPRDVAVQSFPDMLIVASGGRVWGLRGTPEKAKLPKSP
jgi:hypothetical protein